MLKELPMKLDVAAATLRTTHHSSTRIFVSLLSSLLILFASGSAFALDGIDLSNPASDDESGGCPPLIQIKYPFIDCPDDEIGLDDADDTWENSRRIPLMSRWTEGDGTWGPDLNSD